MMSVTHQELVDLSAVDQPFALAISVLRDRLSHLSSDDRDDLNALIPLLLSDDPQEQNSAYRTVREILQQGSVTVLPMNLEAGANAPLDAWLEHVSQRIKIERELAGLTQEQLAEQADLPQSHISRLENRKHSPTAKTLEKIAQALGIPVSRLDPHAV